MDFRKEMAAFLPLDEDETPVFAGSGEPTRAVKAYNRALEQMAQGHDDVARIALERIATQYPLFVEAKHLFALCLASEGRFGKAEKHLRELLLLDLLPDENQRIEEELEFVHARHRRQREQQRRSGRNSDLLLPVRARLVRGSILEHAGRGRGLEMASEREKAEVLRRLESGEGPEPVAIESGPSPVKSPLLPLLLLVVLLGLLLAAAWMFFLGPRLQESKNNARKIFWLEQRLSEQASVPEIAALQQAYEQFRASLR